jgi:hypothetical protein
VFQLIHHPDTLTRCTAMKKHCICIFALLLLMTPLSWSGEIERIQEKGEITVSLNRGYPPFSMEKEGTISAWMWTWPISWPMCSDVKVRFIRPDTYDQQIPKLLAGESDIIMAAMTRTVERALQVSFSSPYFEVSQAALVRRDKIPRGQCLFRSAEGSRASGWGSRPAPPMKPSPGSFFPPMPSKDTHGRCGGRRRRSGEVDAMVADSPFVQVWRNTHIQHYSQDHALLEPLPGSSMRLPSAKGIRTS